MQTGGFGALVSRRGFTMTGLVGEMCVSGLTILLHKQLHCGHILQLTIYLLRRCKSGRQAVAGLSRVWDVFIIKLAEPM